MSSQHSFSERHMSRLVNRGIQEALYELTITQPVQANEEAIDLSESSSQINTGRPTTSIFYDEHMPTGSEDITGLGQCDEDECLLKTGTYDTDNSEMNDEYLNQDFDFLEEGSSLENIDFLEEGSSPENILFTSSDESDDDSSIETDLRSALRKWAIDNQITQNALAEQLGIWRRFCPQFHLPVDARTLIYTPTQYVGRILADNATCYFGLKNAIEKKINAGITEKLFVELENGQRAIKLTLTTNIDGVPVFKSKNSSFWPILCVLQQSVDQDPFVVAIHYGSSKPKLEIFLGEFVNEMMELSSGAFLVQNEFFVLVLSGLFICDAPARAFLKCVKSHSGYYSCERCNQKGKRENCRLIFTETNAQLRSDNTFRSRDQVAHHTGVSPFSRLPIDMIYQFPLDPMHLVYLGVMRKLLVCWVKKKHTCLFRIRRQLVTDLSTALESLKSFVPEEFSRKPRSVNELDRWKATELRQFLLYTGPVVLRTIGFFDPAYQHFLMLHVAVAILCRSHFLTEEYMDYASALMRGFVEHTPHLYSRDFLVYNVHSLLHLPDDVRRNSAPLDAFSAFKFESALGQLRRLLRTPKNPLESLRRRLSERDGMLKKPSKANPLSQYPVVSMQHNRGPLPEGVHAVQYKKVTFRDFTLRNSEGDNCCCLIDGTIVRIKNIIKNHADEIAIVGVAFQVKESFYSYPCDSLKIGEVLVSYPSEDLQVWPINVIATKCVLLPFEEKMVAISLAHNE